jgi:GNAT superfamily N-acetyltransferase
MFRIRFAQIQDQDDIVSFQIKMAKESEGIDLDRNALSKGVDAVFKDPRKGQYYVAEDDGKVIGSMLTTYEWSDWRNQYIYWLQSVYLLPEYRGKNIFGKMYAHLKQKAIEDSQVGGIRLYVDERNHHALKVYKAIGMNGDHYRTFEWMKNE